MPAIRRFEDILAWQKARVLTREIYKASSVGEFARDFGLKNQIRRASVSTMSNIAEGFERATPNEFCRFLGIAKGSGAEVRSDLHYPGMEDPPVGQAALPVRDRQGCLSYGRIFLAGVISTRGGGPAALAALHHATRDLEAELARRAEGRRRQPQPQVLHGGRRDREDQDLAHRPARTQ